MSNNNKYHKNNNIDYSEKDIDIDGINDEYQDEDYNDDGDDDDAGSNEDE